MKQVKRERESWRKKNQQRMLLAYVLHITELECLLFQMAFRAPKMLFRFLLSLSRLMINHTTFF